MKNIIPDVSVEILFNGKPCKQYTHEGEIFIEAKQDSKYEISVKNHNSYRVECVIGVDGINVVTGETNTEQSTGYVIDKYGTLKLDGYRLSDDKVAVFRFNKKGESYASGKSVNAQNGVINIRCYKEKETFSWVPSVIIEEEPIVIRKRRRYIYEYETLPWYNQPWRYSPPLICGGDNGAVGISSTYNGIDNLKFNRSVNPTTGNLTNSVNFCSTNLGGNEAKYSSIQNEACIVQDSIPSEQFDMGTSFGEAKESKVTHVQFQRGDLLGEINIFYASRESLKGMGINLTNEQKIVFPQGVSKYCKPPEGWKG